MNGSARWVGFDLSAGDDVTALALVRDGRVYPLTLPRSSDDIETRGRNEAGYCAAAAAIPE